MRLSDIASFGIGKVLIGMIILLSGAIIALGLYTLSVSGERNVLEQTVKTKEAETNRERDNVSFYKAWMERDKIDALKKEAEFNRTMAAKPVFKTKIEYVPTGNDCDDFNGIINEVRGGNQS